MRSLFIGLAASALLCTACQPAENETDTGTEADTSAEPEATSSETTDQNAGAAGTDVEAAWPDAPVDLVQLWTLDGFSAPEGVALAPDGNYFISNVAGNGDAEDGSGWISKISPFGEMIEAEFATGLDAPKGMVVDRGLLYVADINKIRVINSSDGSLLRTIDVEGADFLNDMTAWNAAVLASDSGTGRIYQLNGDEVSIWLEDERLQGANGLLPDGDRLLIATMGSGSLYEATAAGDLTEIASGMENADGIAIIDGGYLVSSWPGQIFHVTNDGEVSIALDTRAQSIFQNDLTLLNETVIVPNWMPGTVTAWKVDRVG